jgi:hypothetical protein
MLACCIINLVGEREIEKNGLWTLNELIEVVIERPVAW